MICLRELTPKIAKSVRHALQAKRRVFLVQRGKAAGGAGKNGKKRALDGADKASGSTATPAARELLCSETVVLQI